MRIQLVHDNSNNRFELFDADSREYITYETTLDKARTVATRIIKAGAVKTTVEVLNG